MNFDSIRAPAVEAQMYLRRGIGDHALHLSRVRSPRRNLRVNTNRNITTHTSRNTTTYLRASH